LRQSFNRAADAHRNIANQLRSEPPHESALGPDTDDTLDAVRRAGYVLLGAFLIIVGSAMVIALAFAWKALQWAIGW
jgi:hypothetical protein